MQPMKTVGKAFIIFITLVLLLSAILSFPAQGKDITNYNVFKEALTVSSPNSTLTYKDTMPINCELTLTRIGPTPDMWVNNVFYSIDNGTQIGLPKPAGRWCPDIAPVTINIQGNADISNLPNGIHQLWVFANGMCNINDDGYTSWNTSLSPVPFSVYNTPPPSIVILAPLNVSYEVANLTRYSLPLDFSVGKTVSWIGYSLDNQENVTLTGNLTLTGLTYGNHTLTLFANDTLGNIGSSQTINFAVAMPEAKPFPILIVAAVSTVIIAVIVVIVGLLFYLRKHKQNVTSQT
jgi:hypothetical protein